MSKKEITIQMSDHPMRRVVQAVEPEAARLLTEQGGNVTRYEPHGMYYWDYQPCEEHSLLFWPPNTLSVHVSARGQEDSVVIFAVFLLPACTQELHMVYDYRRSSPSGPFEEQNGSQFPEQLHVFHKGKVKEEGNRARANGSFANGCHK